MAEPRAASVVEVAAFHNAASALPEPPPHDRPVNSYAVGLDPARWEADGLFSEPGLTLAEAMDVVDGLVARREAGEGAPA